MKILIKLSLILLSPYLLVVYWRNSLHEVENLHANYELNYEQITRHQSQMIDQDMTPGEKKNATIPERNF